MSSHEASFARVRLNNAIQYADQSKLPRLCDVFRNFIVVLDGSNECSDIGGKPATKMQSLNSKEARIVFSSEKSIHGLKLNDIRRVDT